MATSDDRKKMPDVLQMDMSYIKQYVDKGQLLDLTPYIEDGTLDTTNISEDVVNMGLTTVSTGSLPEPALPVCSIIRRFWMNWGSPLRTT